MFRLAFIFSFLITLLFLLEPPLLAEDEIFYRELKNTLSQWSKEKEVKVPELRVRWNKSNEAYYSSSVITLLVTKSLDHKFREAMMAHEFGHHVIEEKKENLSDQDKEMKADLIAESLVGQRSDESSLVDRKKKGRWSSSTLRSKMI